MPDRYPGGLAHRLKDADHVDVAESVLRTIVMHAEQALWRRCQNEAFSIVLLDGRFVCHLGSMPGSGWEFMGHGTTLRDALTDLIADIHSRSQEAPRHGA